MARVTPPYFFDEFLRPLKRDEPTPRERELGLTVKDLDWLHTLYYATDAARQDKVLRTAPMVVEKFVVTPTDAAPVALVGVFMMAPSPDAGKALLYTPYDGLEVFESRDALMDELIKRINKEAQPNVLFDFLSLSECKTLSTDKALTLTASIIEGAVQEDQEHAIEAAQQRNRRDLLDELCKLPPLQWMLDTLLGIMARTRFPALDQRDTQVNTFVTAQGENRRRWVGSIPLSEALLQFYVNHAWPAGQTRTYVNPRHLTTGFTEDQVRQDLENWDRLIEQTSGLLTRLLGSLLHTYWHADRANGESRLTFFANVMNANCRADLLLKRQAGIISSTEYHQLQALLLPDQTARSAHAKNLNIEKIRVDAPYQHYVELAGTLMASDTHAYLYTQHRGLQVLKDLDDLQVTLLSMLKAAGHEDELLNFLSLEERSVFLGLDQVRVNGSAVTGHVFTELAEGIAAKQISNMEHALALYRQSGGQVDLSALLDCALDVRSMFDPRLLELDAGGRWSLHPVSGPSGRPSTVKAERAKQVLAILQAGEAALAAARNNHPTVRSLATHALNDELQKQALDLKAQDVYLNAYSTTAQEREERPPERSISMVEHFIERLAGETGTVPDTARTGFYGPRQDGAAYKIGSLTHSAFNTIIQQVLLPFSRHDIRDLPRLFLDNHRQLVSEAMGQGLRSEADLRRLSHSLPERAAEVLATVLEGDSPTRQTRHGLNGFLPDAFALTVNSTASAAWQALANCFVLSERGGTDPQRSGQMLLWTPGRGCEAFASLSHLRDVLDRRLKHPEHRLHLLENLPVSQRTPHQVFQLGPLQRIDDHLLDNRQLSHRDHVLDGIDHQLSMGLGARSLQNSLDALMQRASPTNLERATRIAKAMLYQQALPAWLGMAPPREQHVQAELLEQQRLSAPDERDYLHGIPSLREQAAQALRALLKARFPDQAIDPEDVLIPTRVELDGRIQTLADFAIRHLPDLSADDIRPRSRSTQPLPKTLDGHAVVQLVQQLNLRQIYQDLFGKYLGCDTEDTRQRRHTFCRQLPWQLLRHAHEEWLEERLSNTAWSLVRQVFDMPDAVARAAMQGATANIRPLELLATAGATAARAVGLYLIGTADDPQAPLVLYSPYRAGRVLQEFSCEDELLQALNRPGDLQAWVAQHLEAMHRATYRNLWRQTARDDASDIRLATNPIEGNALLRLFNDNLKQINTMLTCQFDPLGKPQWEAVSSLLRKGIPMALDFLAGKLNVPKVIWRSYSLLKSSAEHLQQHRWSEGLRTFIQGVAQLASLRKEFDTLLGTEDPAAPQPSVHQWLNAPAPAATRFATLDITEPQRTRMQVFEDHDTALNELKFSPLSHVYTDTTATRSYVPVAGKVYPVKRAGQRWCILHKGLTGPCVQRNAKGEWVLDLDRHHPRYGKTLSRLAGKINTQIAQRQVINIEAVGMQAIRALSSWKAQCIDEALNVATYYSVNCKRNIRFFAAERDPVTRLGRFFGELFGIHRVTPEQLGRIEKKVDDVLNALVAPSLTRPDSARFVCGTSRWTPDSTYAFTLPDDDQKKIYLLNRFFDPMMDVYQNRLTSPFDISAHARASTLIHELTHLESESEDIAYLDSMRPFHDLIDTNIPGAPELKSDLADVRRCALSTLTPELMLFKAWDAYSDAWDDLGYDSTTRPVKNRVLQITGAKTLDDARRVFMSDENKRMDIILANADSVAYMITQLGRELDAGA
ncbi:hypothetical protein I7860_27145 [Pseudomonas tolaasii]|uniref:hypothetical protein n=1 Tax=Pseudomonas tolaasii TaxID=29442 RepID=UPI001C57A212|nr:hypothetical protein [Pseudomonas tolaasii]MBW1250353.1 hypothetical protein [Pseudomonas tolaasii]